MNFMKVLNDTAISNLYSRISWHNMDSERMVYLFYHSHGFKNVYWTIQNDTISIRAMDTLEEKKRTVS